MQLLQILQPNFKIMFIRAFLFHSGTDSEDKKFIFELSGDKWRVNISMIFTVSNKQAVKSLRVFEKKTPVILSALQKLPEDLQYMTYLREWHIQRTQIQKLPEYIEQFVDLCVLDMPKNRLTQLPAEIGQFLTILFHSYA